RLRGSGELEMDGAHRSQLAQRNTNYIAVGGAAHAARPVEVGAAEAHVVVVESSARGKNIVREIPIGPSRTVAAAHDRGFLHGDANRVLARARSVLEKPYEEVLARHVRHHLTAATTAVILCEDGRGMDAIERCAAVLR